MTTLPEMSKFSHLNYDVIFSALVQLETDLTAVKSCMTDPSTTDCTAVYGDSSSLPSTLAGKCEAATCSGCNIGTF